MYFRQGEHNPPHIHAIYGDNAVAVDIQTGIVLDGNLPTKELGLVEKWIKLHKTELIKIWNTQEFIKIAPLK